MFMTPNLRNALAAQQGNKVAPSQTGAVASPAPSVAVAPQQPPKTVNTFGATPGAAPSAAVNNAGFWNQARQLGGQFPGLRNALMQARQRHPGRFSRGGY